MPATDNTEPTSGSAIGAFLRRTADTRRVLMLCVALVLVAALIYRLGLRHTGPIAAPVAIPWWALAAVFGAAEIFVVHLYFRREAHTISLSELPVVLSLLFASPRGFMTAYLVGAGLALWLHRRQPVLKLVFNLSAFCIQIVAGLVVFHALVADVPAIGFRLWLSTVAAVLTVDAVAVGTVTLVIAIHQRRTSSRQVIEMLASAMAAGIVNTTLALMAATLLWADVRTLWLLVAAAVVIVTSYRAYASLRSRHASLELLYEFTRAVGEAPEADRVIFTVLSQAKELMRAQVAEVVFFGTGDGHVDRAVLGTDGVLAFSDEDDLGCRALTELAAGGKTVIVPRGSRNAEHRALIDATGCRDAIIAPLRAERGLVGALAVSNRLGDVGTYEAADAPLFETIANHASVSLQNGRLVDQLRHEALHDSLTGLPNRRMFHDKVEEALRVLDPTNDTLAVMLMDLDRFKEINDALGHHNGDALLQEVSRRLRRVLDPSITVARLGGDEFAVVAPRLHSHGDAVALAKRAREALAEPFMHEEMLLEVGATIGIALAPEHGDDPSTLLRRADVAMYAAKGTLPGVAIYTVELDEYSPARLALVGELRQAISAGQLDVYYQPKACLEDGTIVGVEALVRWPHPERGQIFPDDFIPLAEQTGLIGPLTTLVLERAMSDCRRWTDEGRPLAVSVNISARSLLDVDLASGIASVLRRTDVTPEHLTLEVTESSVMSDPARMIGVLEQLRGMGLSISVDDFGTGYSSLAYLKRLPITEVKIDKSFVINMSTDHNDAVIVRSIIDLARNLGLQVVAEGVEDQAAWDVLAALGCDIAQGYLLSRPVPAAVLEEWLVSHPVGFQRPVPVLEPLGEVPNDRRFARSGSRPYRGARS